jgi:hypothetical protein
LDVINVNTFLSSFYRETGMKGAYYKVKNPAMTTASIANPSCAANLVVVNTVGPALTFKGFFIARSKHCAAQMKPFNYKNLRYQLNFIGV